MLKIECAVHDASGRRYVMDAVVIRHRHHPKLKKSYYYLYRATIDKRHFNGMVLHNYDNGAPALIARVMRHLIKQQKAIRNAAI